MLQIYSYPTQNITFRGKLIPLKDHKGPLLRDIWTPEEKAEIERLRREIVELDTSMMKQDIRYSGRRARTETKDRYENRGSTVDELIASLKAQIKQIEVNCMNRYREQHKEI